VIVPFGREGIATLMALRRLFPARPVTLIGATALGCHIPMTWRRTEDLDIVVALSIEDASRTLGSVPGWSRNPRKEHEWRAPEGVQIDLLPVSDEALASGALVWPSTGHTMSLLGMRHALAAAPTEIAEGLELAIPSVPVIALLKMVSFLDRPFERERDLSDLAHIFNEYPAADDERLFTSAIVERGLTLETAMTYVLGGELAKLADSAEAAAVRQFLQRVRRSELGRFVVNGPWSRFEPEQAESRLDALEAGFLDGLTQRAAN